MALRDVPRLFYEGEEEGNPSPRCLFERPCWWAARGAEGYWWGRASQKRFKAIRPQSGYEGGMLQLEMLSELSAPESFLGKRRQGGAEGVKEEDDDGMAVVVL